VRVGNDVRPLSTGSRAFGTFVGLEGSELDLRMQNGDTIDFPSTAIERVEERLSVPG